MTKKCPKCPGRMYPITEELPWSPQTDETRPVLTWYCPICNTTHDMTENEEIEVSVLLKEKEEEL